MKRLILFLCLLLPLLLAQGPSGNVQCSDRSVDDSTNACANTRFMQKMRVFNVRSYGAKGNSSGAALNGHDDTAAIQAAVNAAAATVNGFNQTGGTVYFPCSPNGAYRVTSSIIGSNINTTYHFAGDGKCSQIFNDNPVPFTTILINRASNSGCCSAPNLSVVGLNFIHPTTISNSTYAIDAQFVSSPVFDNITIGSYGRGIKLKTSYGPHILNSTFYGLSGTAIKATDDDTFNNGLIWGSRFFGDGLVYLEPAVDIGPGNTGGCVGNPTNVSIIGNDVEGTSGGFRINGGCAIGIRDNYIASNDGFPFAFGVGYNQAVEINGNYIAENATRLATFTGSISGTTLTATGVVGSALAVNDFIYKVNPLDTSVAGNTYITVVLGGGQFTVNNSQSVSSEPMKSKGYTFAMANVAGVNFGANSWFDQRITWSGLTAINWSAFQSTTGNTALQSYCPENVDCSYLTNGWLTQWGRDTTSGGTKTVAFWTTCPTNVPAEVLVTNLGTVDAYLRAPSASLATNQMVVTSSVAATDFSWHITCN